MTTDAKPNLRDLSPAELAGYIQHTRIDATTTRGDAIAHAEECVTYGFGTAMVAGSWVGVTAEVLAGTDIAVASALDFPTVGIATSAGKAAEAAQLVRLGATQLDMGVQIGWLKSGDFEGFREDIAGVVRAAGVPVKVMLELPLLTDAERDTAVDLAVEAGATYLKNASSGAVEVASPESIAYLASRAPAGVAVKASGGIKTYQHAVALLEAGAACLGTSAGRAIVSASADTSTGSY